MGPSALNKLLKLIPPQAADKRVLLGLDIFDDAGVFLINEDTAIVQTVDFFTPIVDDPGDFGRIAAVNALSDIYAMGATPVVALNIVAYPSNKLPLYVLARIMQGGQEKVQEAGATIIGGHTVEDDEPKYGLAVTGIVHPEKIIAKGGARPDDILILTKPVGTGILTTALKRGEVSEEDIEPAVDMMKVLNRGAAEILNFDRVNALTDVTGFGLLGHLYEILKASNVAARLRVHEEIFLPHSVQLADKGMIPGGTLNNLKHLQKSVHFNEGIPEHIKFLLADAMTSGGLLATVSPDKAKEVIDDLKASKGVPAAFVIGEILPGKPGIYVE